MLTLIVEAALVANFVPSDNDSALQAAVAMFFIYQIFYVRQHLTIVLINSLTTSRARVSTVHSSPTLANSSQRIFGLKVSVWACR